MSVIEEIRNSFENDPDAPISHDKLMRLSKVIEGVGEQIQETRHMYDELNLDGNIDPLEEEDTWWQRIIDAIREFFNRAREYLVNLFN